MYSIARGYEGQAGLVAQPLPIAVRIRLLLRSSMSMTTVCSGSDGDTTPFEASIAAWRTSSLIQTLMTHDNVHFRMYALEALQSVLARKSFIAVWSSIVDISNLISYICT
jgi:hypothetical protein